MLSPGQNLEALISCLNTDDLSEIAGVDVVATVSAMAPPDGLVPTLRRVASDFLRSRPDELLGEERIRRIFYSAMSVEKLDELATRLDLANRQSLQRLDPKDDAIAWQRYLGFFGIDAPAEPTAIVELDTKEVAPAFGLFAHQRDAAARVLDTLADGFGRVVLHMPTGAGKTRTAMHVVCRFLNSHEPGVVTWLAASAELLEQAAEAFQQAWYALGNRPVNLLRFWGDYAPDIANIGDGLVVAGLQKMYRYGTREPIGLLRLASRSKLIVVDEAHQAIAPTFKSTIARLADTGTHNALLGLTATPGRTWSDIGADEQLATFFGDRKVMLQIEGWDDPIAYLMNEGYLAKPSFRRLEYRASPETRRALQNAVSDEDDYNEAALSALALSIDRNVSIIHEVRRMVEVGHRRILVFAASVRHAQIIAAALSAINLDGRVIAGDTPKSTRQRIIKAFLNKSQRPIILCNYGVLTTGFDAPNTSAAIIARPTRSLVLYSQMVGRAIRGPRAGGNATCEVSTVVDIDLPGFGDVAQAFENWEDVWREDIRKR